MVPEAGLEPARYFYRGILSPLCLPIPPLGLKCHAPDLCCYTYYSLPSSLRFFLIFVALISVIDLSKISSSKL